MKRRIALFKDPRFPQMDSMLLGDEATEKYCRELVRVSAWVDVEFEMLPPDQAVELAALERARSAAQAHFDREMENFRRARSVIEERVNVVSLLRTQAE